MSLQRIHSLLIELKNELNDVDFQSKYTKERILKLTEIIDQTVSNTTLSSTEQEELTTSLENFALNFEVQHPKISTLLNTLIQDLNTLGI